MSENQEPLKGERRGSDRIKKTFIMTYFNRADPTHKYEITQLKNIGMGGMCFVTTKSFPSGTELGVDLKTPYLSDTTHLEGSVLESKEKIKNMIYETRIKFLKLEPQSEFILARMIDFFVNGGKSLNE